MATDAKQQAFRAGIRNLSKKPAQAKPTSFTRGVVEKTPAFTKAIAQKTGEVIGAQIKEGERISQLPVGEQIQEHARRTGNVFTGIAKFAAGSLQEIGRSFASVGIEAQERVTGREQTIKATDVSKFLFGEGDVESLTGRTEKAKEFIGERGGTKLEKAILAPLGILGLTALDVTPFPGKKSLIKALIKQTDEAVIETTLRNAVTKGEAVLDDVSINLIKRDLAGAKTAGDVRKLVETGQRSAVGRGVPIPKRLKNTAELADIQQQLQQLRKETPQIATKVGERKAVRSLEGTLNSVAVKMRRNELKLLRENITFRSTKKKLINDFRTKTKGIQAMQKDLLDFARANLPKTQFKKVATDLSKLRTRQSQLTGLKNVINARNKNIRDAAVKSIDDVTRDLGRLPVSAQDRITGAMEGLKIKNFGKGTTERLTNLRDFLEKNPEKMLDFEAPKNLKDIARIAELDKKSVKELSMEELQKLSNKLEFIRREGLLEKRIVEGRTVDGQRLPGLRQMQIDRKVDELVDTAENLDAPGAIDTFAKDLTASQKRTNLRVQASNQIRKGELNYNSTDNVMNLADGMKSGGAHARFIKEPIDEALDLAEDSANTVLKQFTDKTVEIAKKYGLKEFSQGAWERIGVHALYRQEKGITKLRRSGVTEDVIQSSKALSPAEKEMYEFMRVTLDDLQPRIDNVMRSTHGKRLDKVKEYFPTRPEYEDVPRNAPEDFGTIAGNMSDNYSRKNLEKGFTKGRTPIGAAKYVLNAQDLFVKHVRDATYFIEVEDALNQVRKITTDPRYAPAVGKNMNKWMKGYVDVVARKGVPKGFEYNWFDATKANIGAAVLGFNPSVIIKQPLAKLTSAGFLGKHAVIHDAEYFGNFKRLNKAIDNASVQQRVRAADDPAYTQLSTNKKLSKFQEMGYRGIKEVDKATANNVWYSSYKKYFDDNGIKFSLDDFAAGKVNKAARKSADELVRITQGTGKFKDLPQILRSKDKRILSTIFQFQSFVMNQSQILTHHAIRKEALRNKSLRKAAVLTAPLVGVAVLEDKIDSVKASIYGSDEYKKRIEERTTAEYILDITTSLFPPAGILRNMFESNTGVPVYDTVKRGFQGTKGVFTAKQTETKLKNAEKALETMLAVGGVSGAGFAGTLTRRGIETAFRTPTEELVMAIESKDKLEAQAILRRAEQEGLNTQAILKKAQVSLKRKKTQEAKEVAEKLIPEIRKASDRPAKIQELRDEGILTPLIEKQIVNILKAKGKKEELGE